MSQSSWSSWNLHSTSALQAVLSQSNGRRRLTLALLSAVAVAGTLMVAVLVVRRAKARSRLLTRPDQVHMVWLEHREAVTHNVRLLRFALPYQSQVVLGVPVGQHLFLRARLGGRLVVRPYTPVSGPEQRGSFDLIVKVYSRGTSFTFPAGGTMSQHLDHLRIGDPVEVQGPKGAFIYQGQGEFSFPNSYRASVRASTIGLVAAGSGVTPILQLLRHIFSRAEDRTVVLMVDVNSSERDIIAYEELEELARRFPTRFRVCHVLSKLPDYSTPSYQEGPLSQELMAEHLPPPGPEVLLLVCGPPRLVSEICRPALKTIGHDESRILRY
ncbi:unnamed protein product [Ixodes hexagonus]